jgi:hypothetical protein
MGDELDDPQVLKGLSKRLLVSALPGLAAALLGSVLAFAIHPLVVDGLSLKFFTGWGAFLWTELGALAFGVIGFAIAWKRSGRPRCRWTGRD